MYFSCVFYLCCGKRSTDYINLAREGKETPKHTCTIELIQF